MVEILAQQQQPGLRWLRHHFYFKVDDESKLLEFFDDVRIWLRKNVQGNGITFEKSSQQAILIYLLTQKRRRNPKGSWFAGLGQDDFMVYFLRKKDADAFKAELKITKLQDPEPKLTRADRRKTVKYFRDYDREKFYEQDYNGSY